MNLIFPLLLWWVLCFVYVFVWISLGPCSICDPQKRHAENGVLGGYCTNNDNTGTIRFIFHFVNCSSLACFFLMHLKRCTDYVEKSPSDATCCKKGVQNSKAFRAIVAINQCNKSLQCNKILCISRHMYLDIMYGSNLLVY